MFKILFLLFAFNSTLLANNNYSEVRWKQLFALSLKEEQTIKKNKTMGPRLKHRLFEVYSERIKLIKEKENAYFLRASTSGAKVQKKSFYFQKSQKMYDFTKRFGNDLTKRYPSYPNIGEVYYTLGINARDHNDDRAQEVYFKNAIVKGARNPSIVHNARVGLAEYYYNNKQYEQAILYYKYVVNNQNDEWLSKHYYNLSWCLLKTKNYNYALNYLLKAFELSRKNKFVEMDQQILQAAVYFYVISDQARDGVQFFLTQAKEPIGYVLELSDRVAKDKGDFKTIYYALSKAHEYADQKNLVAEKVDIYLKELEHYRTFKQNDLHYKTSLAILRHHQKSAIPQEKFKQATEQIAQYAGYFQERIAKEFKMSKKVQQPHLIRVQNYFTLLSKLDPRQVHIYSFLKGETYFSVKNFTTAANWYRKSLTQALELNKQNILAADELEKIKHKNVDSLLACIGENSFDKNKLMNFTVYTYVAYLTFWPKGDKSVAIYNKLFNLYFQKQMYDKAIALIDSYHQNHPRNTKNQREMLTSILDIYIAKKNTQDLSIWLAKLNQGYLSYPKNYIVKAEIILGQLLFENYQKLEKLDKNEEAIAGYTELYNDKRYPVKIKAESSYKISILHLKQGDVSKSFEWFAIANKFLSNSDFDSRLTNIFEMSQQYYFLQDFESSRKTSLLVLDRKCPKAFKHNGDFFDQTIHFYLIEDQASEAIKAFNKYKECGVSKKDYDKVIDRFITYYESSQDTPRLVELFQLLKNSSHQDRIVAILYQSYWTAQVNGQNAQYIIDFFQKNLSTIAKLKSGSKVTKLFEFKNFEREMAQVNFRFPAMEPKFDENLFQQTLDQHINLLASINEKAERLQKSGDQYLVLGSNLIVIDLFGRFTQELSVVKVLGMNKEFEDSFYQSMKGVISQVNQQRDSMRNTMSRDIASAKALTPFNYKYFMNQEIQKYSNLPYRSLSKGMTLDRL